MSEENQRFKALLDEHHIWPTSFPFKFIVYPDKVEMLKELLETDDVSLRHSRTGKYVSVSISMEMNSSDEVIEIYERVKVIDGIIPL